MTINIQVDRRDAGRILQGLRERRRKLQRSVDKWGDEFDPELGSGSLEGLAAYTALIHKITEEIQNEN